jgi:predicted nucleotidyltransferase
VNARDANPQLDAVLAAVRESLGRSVVAAYLHGSAVLGGLRQRSDLDVLVVISRPTTHDEKQRITDGLLAISNRDGIPGFERPIELTIVVQPDIRPWRYPPPIDFQYGEWLRDRFERGALAPERPTNPDLTIVLQAALRASRALVGPPAADVLDPIPPADLVRAMTDELDSLLADLDTDTCNVILTLARIWTTAATGEIRSKDAAADWVLDRLPPDHRPVLARSRAIYLGDEDDRWDDLHNRIRPFVDHLIAEIRRA